MCEDIATNFLLSRLHEVDVSKHALVFESTRQFACDCCSRMKTGEGDELEDKSIAIKSVYYSTCSCRLGGDKPMLRKVPHEALQRLFREALT